MNRDSIQADGRDRTYSHQVSTLARLRVLVGYLGERDQFNWWPTSFLSPTGRRYLEFNFPRTLLSAGVNSVAQAAKDLHDQRIGRSGVFHLFRLPHSVEQDLHALLTSNLQEELVSLIRGRDDALRELENMAQGQTVSDVGPIRVSGLAQLTNRPSIRKVAACYRNAFEAGHQVFPYFTAE